MRVAHSPHVRRSTPTLDVMSSDRGNLERVWNAYKVVHLAVFNFGARRVVASGLIVVGTVLAIYNAPGLLPGGTTLVQGVPSDDLVFRWAVVLLPAAMALFGVALFRAKPYSPRRE